MNESKPPPTPAPFPAPSGTSVVAVSGVKNSGKTTVLAGIIPLLRQGGFRVGVIKHDGHDFQPDVPGTDSFRLRKAGAGAVGVYSPRRMMITAEEMGLSLQEMIARMPGGLDVILVEGAKHSDLPKIEVLRGAVSRALVCDPAHLLAVAADVDIDFEGAPLMAIDDFQGLAKVIIDHLKGL